MKIISSLATLSVVAFAQDDDVHAQAFHDFITRFNKNYDESERAARFGIFKANLLMAEEAQHLHPRATFGVTKFSDLTPEEFARRHGLQSTDKPHKPSVPLFTAEEIAARPTSFDWR